MSKLALGTAQFGMNYGINSKFGKISLQEVKNILNYASSQEIELLDTAPSYGDCEKILGNSRAQNFKIVTKTKHFKETVITNEELIHMENDFLNSLNHLGKESVYGLLVHNANDLSKEGSIKLFNSLEKLKLEKKIEKIGVSVYDNSQLEKIINNFNVDIIQLPFNILDQRLIHSGMLTALNKKGIEIHARSIFLQGLLLMEQNQIPSKFKNWSGLWKTWQTWLKDNKISALEATIRYALSFFEISKVIVGVETKKQLKEILAASTGNLPKIPPELFTDDTNLLNPTKWSSL